MFPARQIIGTPLGSKQPVDPNSPEKNFTHLNRLLRWEVKRKMFLFSSPRPFCPAALDCLLINGALRFVSITGFPMLLTGRMLIE